MPTGTKVTKEDFVSRLASKGRGYTIRDGYEFHGMNKRVNIVCPEHPDNIWEPIATNLINKDSNCPICSKCKKLSESDVIDRLSENPYVGYISGYINTGEKCLFFCKCCGHQWSAKPNSIFNGTRCIKCFGNEPLTNDDVDQRLVGSGLKRVGEYISSSIKIDFECLGCGHVWGSTPTNIFSGNGCPKCATHGYLYEEPSNIYYAKLLDYDNIFKIGVTKRLPAKRLVESSSESVILWSSYVATGRAAVKFENHILKKFKHLIQKKYKFSGSTECFTQDIRNYIDLSGEFEKILVLCQEG